MLLLGGLSSPSQRSVVVCFMFEQVEQVECWPSMSSIMGATWGRGGGKEGALSISFFNWKLKYLDKGETESHLALDLFSAGAK